MSQDNVVEGNAYLRAMYAFESSHLWRDLGLLSAYTALFGIVYLAAAEFIPAQRPKGDILTFKYRQRMLKDEERSSTRLNDREKGSNLSLGLQQQTSIFTWEGICYEVATKKRRKCLLTDVDGWVKPGTLTALMVGSSDIR